MHRINIPRTSRLWLRNQQNMLRILPASQGSFGSTVIPARGVKVYTRTGDDGTSALFAQGRMVRRPKTDQVFEVLGTIDELNAHVGLVAAFCRHDDTLDDLKEICLSIQRDLVEAGTCIAYQPTADKKDPAYANFQSEPKIKDLENWIDELTLILSPLTSFVLQTGGRSTCTAHVARAVCRRGERELNRLKEIQEHADDGSSIDQIINVSKYLNRLSDLLFTMARYIIVKQGGEDTPYSARNAVKPE